MVEDYRTFLMPLFGYKNRSLNMYISDSKHLRFKNGNKEKKLFEILIKSCYVFFYWNAKLNNLKFAPNKPYPPHPLPQKPPLIITWLRCYSYLTIYMEFHSSRPFLPSCWRRSPDPVFISTDIDWMSKVIDFGAYFFLFDVLFWYIAYQFISMYLCRMVR